MEKVVRAFLSLFLRLFLLCREDRFETARDHHGQLICYPNTITHYREERFEAAREYCC